MESRRDGRTGLFEMENKIGQAAIEIVKKGHKVNIEPYADLTDSAIDGMFVEESQKEEIRNLYQKVLCSRDNLSSVKFMDFNSAAFLGLAQEYLLAVKALFQYFYKTTNNTYEAQCLDVIRQIVQSDISKITKTSPRKVEVSLCNPIVLESLLIVHYQIKDYDEPGVDKILDKDAKEDFPVFILAEELFRVSVERLFKDIVILYNEEEYSKGFYRITDFDEISGRFVAVREDDMCSIEEISAPRLFREITDMPGGNDIGEKKCFIIGSLKEGSLRVLDSMLDSWQKKNAMCGRKLYDFVGGRKKIAEIISNSKNLLNLLRRYRKIFILDCPALYGDILLEGRNDAYEYMYGSSDETMNFLDIDEKKQSRDFDNANTFATIYYRVQNYLVNKYMANGVKTRYMNSHILDYLYRLYMCEDKGIGSYFFGDSEIALYYSEGGGVNNGKSDLYSLTRLGEHDLKTCRTVEFSYRKTKPIENGHDAIRLNFFKVLEAVSSSGKFYCDITGDEDDSPLTADRISNAIYMAQNTEIVLQHTKNGTTYKVLETGFTRKYDYITIKITVRYPQKGKDGYALDVARTEKYCLAIKQILKWAFESYRNPDIKNYVLFDRFQKIFADALADCAVSYNDLLFCHLYKKQSSDDFGIKIDGPEFSPIAKESDLPAGEKKTVGFSRKRTAFSIMDAMDAKAYRDSDVMTFAQMASQNDEALNDYLLNIKRACENMNYTDSGLYERIRKYV